MNIIQLEKKHIRSSFNCEHQSLTDYLQKNVNQDIKRNLARCYVLADDKNFVLAYYTLSNAQIPKTGAPEKWIKKIPYPNIPVTLLGRLAVHKEYQGKGYGKALLKDALLRSLELSKSIGSVAVIVDPIDQNAVNFYEKYGFELLDSGKMFLSIGTISKAYNN